MGESAQLCVLKPASETINSRRLFASVILPVLTGKWVIFLTDHSKVARSQVLEGFGEHSSLTTIESKHVNTGYQLLWAQLHQRAVVMDGEGTAYCLYNCKGPIYIHSQSEPLYYIIYTGKNIFATDQQLPHFVVCSL